MQRPDCGELELDLGLGAGQAERSLVLTGREHDPKRDSDKIFQILTLANMASTIPAA